MESSRQQRLMRLLRQRLLIILLILVVFLLIPAVWSAWGKEGDSRTNRIEAETELARQVERQEALEQEVAELQTERGIEQALRKRFDVGYEGESVIYIVDATVTPEVSADDSQGGIWGFVTGLWPF